MYQFKVEKREELLDGRTTRWLANAVGVNEGYISQVLNGKRTCSVVLASLILVRLHSDKEVEEYFVKKEK